MVAAAGPTNALTVRCTEWLGAFGSAGRLRGSCGIWPDLGHRVAGQVNQLVSCNAAMGLGAGAQTRFTRGRRGMRPPLRINQAESDRLSRTFEHDVVVVPHSRQRS